MSIVGPLYPVNLVVAGKPCLVVGGGRVAARKADELVRCRANVRVVAVDVSAEMRGLEGVEIDERPYRAGEVSG
jgi:siroheme synthase (precorrin-2 oxidase/ferrochelatase)